jgi:cytochrome c-type biogenesis protein CcmE
MSEKSEQQTASALMRRKTRRFMIGALVVAGTAFAVIAGTGINENLVYYWTPSDLVANGEKAYGATIRLGGMVAPASIEKLGGSAVAFVVHDGKSRVKVRTSTVPPQMFRENIGVVVEGTMVKGGEFQSTRLMVSHDNNYESKDKKHSMEEKDLRKMIESADESQGT